MQNGNPDNCYRLGCEGQKRILCQVAPGNILPVTSKGLPVRPRHQLAALPAIRAACGPGASIRHRLSRRQRLVVHNNVPHGRYLRHPTKLRLSMTSRVPYGPAVSQTPEATVLSPPCLLGAPLQAKGGPPRAAAKATLPAHAS